MFRHRNVSMLVWVLVGYILLSLCRSKCGRFLLHLCLHKPRRCSIHNPCLCICRGKRHRLLVGSVLPQALRTSRFRHLTCQTIVVSVGSMDILFLPFCTTSIALSILWIRYRLTGSPRRNIAKCLRQPPHNYLIPIAELSCYPLLS